MSLTWLNIGSFTLFSVSIYSFYLREWHTPQHVGWVVFVNQYVVWVMSNDYLIQFLPTCVCTLYSNTYESEPRRMVVCVNLQNINHITYCVLIRVVCPSRLPIYFLSAIQSSQRVQCFLCMKSFYLLNRCFEFNTLFNQCIHRFNVIATHLIRICRNMNSTLFKLFAVVRLVVISPMSVM